MTQRQPRRDGEGWYRINGSAGDVPAQILIYDSIGMFGVTAADFVRDLASVSGPVDVHINSGGGDVFDAFAIYNALAARPGVTTVVDSLAASAASVITMAGSRRLMARTSQMMIHEGWADSFGDAADMRHLADRLDTVSGQIAGIYAEAAGGDPARWRDLMRAETWFTPEQALEAGLITGIVTRDQPEAPQPAAVPAGAAPAGAVMNAAPAQDAPQAAAVDNSPWDGNAAMSSCSSAADYRSICAGEKNAGSPDERQHWALPHHKSPGAAPNAAGVRSALSRLPQTQDLKNKQAAQAHLDAHMSAISPSGHAGQPVNGKDTGMKNEGELTIEARRSRITEIQGLQQEIAAAYPAAVLPSDKQAEWDQLVAEARDHRAALDAVDRRNAEMAELLAAGPSADLPRDDSGRPAGAAAGQLPQAQPYAGGAPAAHLRHDIYDLGAIRQRARSIDELPMLLRDNAMRAVEQHRFPGARSREQAQATVARLLDTVDDENGALARRVLVTGSPLYDQAFGKALRAQSVHGLSGQEIKALSLGTDSAGGFAVPFQLDPTVILTNNGVINPLREIARVEQITGKEYDFVTSTGVTVSRVAEATEAADGSPVLAQPTIRTTRVQAFVPFSIELDVSWNELRSQMTYLLTDAKAVEEGAGTSGFVLGNGTAPNAGGIITTMGTASQVSTATTATLVLADLDALEGAIPVRFRANSKYLASKTTYNKLRSLFRAQASSAGDGWARPSQGQPAAINGYDAYEASAMSGSVTTSGALVLLQGDFRQFLIVDRVGMGIELIPHLFGSSNRFPTGQRGILAIWFNNSTILVQNAFRLLKIL
jgi:HK97 family phage major capsid protein